MIFNDTNAYAGIMSTVVSEVIFSPCLNIFALLHMQTILPHLKFMQTGLFYVQVLKSPSEDVG